MFALQFLTFSAVALGVIAFSDFQNQSLKAHNLYRAKHGVPPLALDQKLCNFAQEWANYLASNNLFQHRSNNKFGENLYGSYSENVPGKEAVEAWYNEINDYDYNNPVFSSETGHFTQVVWKNSKRLGVGIAKGTNGMAVIVANYDPPGNYAGQFVKNVPQPVS